MIQILEVKEKKNLAEIRKKLDIAEDEAIFIAMSDKDDQMGISAIRLDKKTLSILKFWIPDYTYSEPPSMEQTFVLDSLLRASASYGETFGADQIKILFPDFYDFFQKRGFERAEGFSFGPMNLIVKYE